MESAENRHEDEIVKGIRDLGKSPTYTELMKDLVEDKGVIAERTLKKYLVIMVEEHKLFRFSLGNNTRYQVVPGLMRFSLASDEEVVRKALTDMYAYLVNIELDFSTADLYDKVLVSVHFYQTLRQLHTIHDILGLKEDVMKEPTMGNTYESVDSLHKSFEQIQDELHRLKDELFDLVSKDADAKTIYTLLNLKAMDQQGLPLDTLIRRHNRTVAGLEKRSKEKGPPLLFKDAKGKPYPSATYSISVKKIPINKK